MHLPRLVALVALTAACGSSSSDPVLRVGDRGAYTVAVPSGWQNVSSETHGPGKVALQTVQRTPPVIAIFSPAPDPMPFDPTDPVDCDTNGGRMPGLQGAPQVVTLPAGKACRVSTHANGHRSVMAVFRSGTHGLMAQCLYDQESDVALCDAIIKRVASTR